MTPGRRRSWRGSTRQQLSEPSGEERRPAGRPAPRGICSARPAPSPVFKSPQISHTPSRRRKARTPGNRTTSLGDAPFSSCRAGTPGHLGSGRPTQRARARGNHRDGKATGPPGLQERRAGSRQSGPQLPGGPGWVIGGERGYETTSPGARQLFLWTGALRSLLRLAAGPRERVHARDRLSPRTYPCRSQETSSARVCPAAMTPPRPSGRRASNPDLPAPLPALIPATPSPAQPQPPASKPASGAPPRPAEAGAVKEGGPRGHGAAHGNW